MIVHDCHAACRLKANGELIQDSQKPLVFISGRRPLTGGLTPGAVEALSTMQAGGKRRIFVPASQAGPSSPHPRGKPGSNHALQPLTYAPRCSTSSTTQQAQSQAISACDCSIDCDSIVVSHHNATARSWLQGFGKEGGVLKPTEHVLHKEGVVPPNAVKLRCSC